MTFRTAVGQEGAPGYVAGEDKDNFNTVMGKFNEFCETRGPQMTLRGQFWAYERSESHTFDQYLTTRKTKVKECKIFFPIYN